MAPWSAESWRRTVTMSPSQIALSIMLSPTIRNRRVRRILEDPRREPVAHCTRSCAVRNGFARLGYAPLQP